MKELNDDGLVPGQAVDFATIHRVNSQRKPVKQAKNEEPSRGRQTKTADAN